MPALLTCFALLSACQAAEVTTSGVKVVDGFEAALPPAFDDHDEVAGSKTSIKVSVQAAGYQGKAIRVDYAVPIDPKVGWGYGGVSVSLKGIPLTPYKVLSFWARMVSGATPVFRVSLVTTHQGRKWQGYSPSVRDLGKDWKQFRISLDKYDGFTEERWANMSSVDLVMMGNTGAIEFDQVTLETSPLPADKLRAAYPLNKVPFENGWAAWCYVSMTANAQGAIEWNRRAKPEQKLRWLYPWAGDLNFKAGKVVFVPAFHNAVALKKALGTEPIHVQAMVDGISRGCEDVSDAEWERAGIEIAKALDAEPLIQGIHLDIEPYAPDTVLLFAAIKRHTKKPVTAAVGAWNKDTFRYVDQLTLMGYDLGKDPKTFGQAARNLYASFMADARATGTPALIGVPAIATHTEFETWGADGKRVGPSMLEFMDEALNAVNLAVKPGDPLFRGLSLWAFHSQGGMLGLQDDWAIPQVITEPMWQKLSAFKRP